MAAAAAMLDPVIIPLKKRETGPQSDLCEDVIKLEEELCFSLSLLSFSSPVTHVYNPLEYAKETHNDYVRKYCKLGQKVIFLGMNPGPFGMAQNGIPFGDTNHVKDWLQIKGTVYVPEKEHRKRPIQGLNCQRVEVSGSRFWEFFKEHSKSPQTLFCNCYVHNYCPLAFMTSSGKNITPPKLPKSERQQLLKVCDKSLVEIVELTGVEIVVGVGKFAEERACKALKDSSVKICSITHPSPASPLANTGWSSLALSQLTDLGLMGYIMNS
ncbi:Single-strand selective monofunctional uracil DNA glycosylase [Acropora cervicornis]|uniref:Single-strand selective monofunctional uracil DNA glycosylase n=1 Tax=Acropora cervicornis TaxID=6130 RepID=A0AAD9QJ24_ACRCE|nr:Single-strand selective monofunctional uracil DNA glycosylase [Acropora cervicornis]